MATDSTLENLFINNLTSTARDNIIKLEQKLQGMKAEINVKLQHPDFYKDKNQKEYLEQLTLISKEIDSAIVSLEGVISLASPADSEIVEDFSKSADTKQFNKMISNYLKQFSQSTKDL